MDRMIILAISEGGITYNISVPDNLTELELENLLKLDGITLPANHPDREEFASMSTATIDYQLLPNWIKTWTADDASTYVHDNVLNGFSSVEVDAYVNNLPNTVAGMKAGLKQIGGALVAIRDILEIIAELLMYIRDLVIRFRN